MSAIIPKATRIPDIVIVVSLEAVVVSVTPGRVIVVVSVMTVTELDTVITSKVAEAVL